MNNQRVKRNKLQKWQTTYQMYTLRHSLYVLSTLSLQIKTGQPVFVRNSISISIIISKRLAGTKHNRTNACW